MTLKVLTYFLIFALALQINNAAPTTEAAGTTTSPFSNKDIDELVQYLLHTSIHKYDAKVSVVQSHIKRFQEAVDMLIDETSADDKEKIKIYNEVREAIEESLNTIEKDTQKCGLYLVAMSRLSHIDSLVASSKDSQLWNYWTLSDIDEKNLFVTLGATPTNVQQHQEAQQFLDENPEINTEAITKAKQYVNESCSKYKEFYKGDIVINQMCVKIN
ncbi:uncharacterized protein [Musca autumnalis]|uniref:uncharacterized protein n=1 Tax=Musca autumnalis TaxID=221902 RepID=UPI003CF30B0F